MIDMEKNLPSETDKEVKKSTYKVEIVPVEMQKHPNADKLSIIPVFGYSYVGATVDWVGKKKGAYLPPDSLVDTSRPEFAFLADQSKADGKARIKAKKLRGVVSFGLMIPVPDDTPLGEDWSERLGVTHYEPPLPGEKRGGFYMGGEAASPPSIYTVNYDVDAFRRYHHLFSPGELVVITEKLDGASSRFVFHDGKMHCGSRKEWKKEYPEYDHVTVKYLTDQGVEESKAKYIVERLHSKPKKKNVWWEILEKTPNLEKFCRANPGVVVYGEVYGNINCIKYGLPDVNRFAAFDVMQRGRWADAMLGRVWLETNGVPVVPLITQKMEGTPYDFDTLCQMAEGPTLVKDAKSGTIREGVVVKPINERYDSTVGRVCFKIVSSAYLEKY